MAKTTKKLKPVGTVSPIDAFLALSDEAKEKAWASVDRDIPESEARPLTPGEQAEWDAFARRAKAKRGRPRVGKGAERINVTVERGLLSRADAFAKQHGYTRAQVVAKGLAAVLAGKRRP
jgi:hypothetical protein